MPIQRKNFFSSVDHAQMLIKLCTENSFFRQKLLSLLNLPYENRQQILTAWIESLKDEANLKKDLIQALEFLMDDEKAQAVMQELEKFDA